MSKSLKGPEKHTVGSYRLPTEILFGAGAVSRLGERAASLHRQSALLITDSGLVSAGLANRVIGTLKENGINVTIFDEVKPNPSIRDVDAAFGAAQEARPDFLVGLGGGSPIDVAKAVGLLLANGGESIAEYIRGRPIEKPAVPLVAIPTTCGTGSEVTTSTVVVDHTEARKVSLRKDTLLCAELAIVDPEMFLTLPPTLVASTGMDALTHAIEAYLSLAANPITDGCALQAIELIAENIRLAWARPANQEPIGRMAIASTVAGMAFGQASTTLVHCISHALGGLLDIPHGLANAILLPYVMRYNLPANPRKFARVAVALGEKVETLHELDAARLSVASVQKLAQDLEIPDNLDAVGVTENDLDAVASQAAKESRLKNNPRIATEKDILTILRQALHA